VASAPTAERGSELTLRTARPADGLALHRIVDEGRVLELNTAYAYVLLSDHFRETTVVAELEGRPVGFVAAYRPPTHPDAVFVWQIGVAEAARGRGLASRLLDTLVRQPGCRGVRFLEATVATDNEPSRRLFESFGRRHDASVEWRDGYSTALLGEGHPPEPLIRIGPLSADARPS
jgi:diaminobutyrate acetyltransferase